MSQQHGENRPAWKAEASHPEQCDLLRKALGEIYDPEIGLSVIQLGLIRDVDIGEDSVKIRMILTTIYCPYGPAMLESVRKKAEESLNRPAAIEIGMENWDFSMMDEDLGADWGLF